MSRSDENQPKSLLGVLKAGSGEHTGACWLRRKRDSVGTCTCCTSSPSPRSTSACQRTPCSQSPPRRWQARARGAAGSTARPPACCPAHPRQVGPCSATRGYKPWRPDAVVSTTRGVNKSVLRLFMGSREHALGWTWTCLKNLSHRLGPCQLTGAMCAFCHFRSLASLLFVGYGSLRSPGGP